MPQYDTSWWLGFGFGAVAGSLLVGSLLGLIPLVLGQVVGQARLGRIGFLTAVVAGLLGGALLALPASLGFVVTILIRWRRQRLSNTSPSSNGV
jgi:hypothetical protein